MILAGRVAVDGETIASPALNVTPGQDIRVDGKKLPSPAPPRLWLFHKPPGVITTSRDPEGRKTVFDLLPPDLPRVVTVGRLDLNSEGLLLLTNDGELARHMSLPATGWKRRYRVRVYGAPDPAALAALKNGVTITDPEAGEISYGPVEAAVEPGEGSGRNCWIAMTLREGKNREIRKICRHLGLAVNCLVRISYGPFQLGALPIGTVKEVPEKTLREQLGEWRQQS